MKDYPENLHIIRTASVKEGLIPCEGAEIPAHLLSICIDYLKIDANETDAEAFDALCKRLREHFHVENPLDSSLN